MGVYADVPHHVSVLTCFVYKGDKTEVLGYHTPRRLMFYVCVVWFRLGWLSSWPTNTKALDQNAVGSHRPGWVPSLKPLGWRWGSSSFCIRIISPSQSLEMVVSCGDYWDSGGYFHVFSYIYIYKTYYIYITYYILNILYIEHIIYTTYCISI